MAEPFPGESRGPGPTHLFERSASHERRAWAPARAGTEDGARMARH